jgi:hypothetical protein
MSKYDLRSCRRWSLAIALALPAAVGCTSEALPGPPPSAAGKPIGDQLAAVSGQLAALPAARVVSRDEQGRARQLLGSSGPSLAIPADFSHETLARLHLQRHARQLGLAVSTLQRSVVESSQVLPGGASVWQFGQRIAGLPVFHARASVVMDGQHQLISLANHLAPEPTGLKSPAFALSPEAAVARAYAAHSGVTVGADAVRAQTRGPGDVDGEAAADFSLHTPPGAARVLEATAKRVLFPAGKALTAAYHIELLLRAAGTSRNRAFGEVISAADGHSLWSTKLTFNDAFSYRVWAEPDGVHIPKDSPLVDATPYAGATPSATPLPFDAPILVSIEGFNKNPQGSADPWLDPSATDSWGNNVRAYSDRNEAIAADGVTLLHDGYDSSSDVRADVTSDKTFDRAYDPTLAPAASRDQIEAAVTQIFYVTNWLHDFWYDSGFDELNHNAQQSNFGRGGIEGDPLDAEAQDGADNGLTDNADMSAFSDGHSPRMQMYVWDGPPDRTIVTVPPITFDDWLGAPSYGPQTYDLTGSPALVLVDDGSTVVTSAGSGAGTTSDACQRFTGFAGAIAVLDRGGCAFIDKLSNAAAAGAVAVLVLDDVPGHIAVDPAPETTSVAIPMLVASYEDGQKVKAALSNGAAQPLTAAVFRRGAEVERDGTIDNTVVAHEWGHYLHLRLVLCGSATCDGMSEGWADFNALLMVIRAGDTFPGQVYPLSQYAGAGLVTDSGYFGLRRAPYSVDLDKNPFTFKHIRAASSLPTGAPLSPVAPEMNEAHNVGEVWAEMLFEAYAGLLTAAQAEGRSFDDSKRRMADYVVLAMKSAPVDPTFVEQRDALLSSIRALASDDSSRATDFNAVAQAFAKRGLGVGAVAPPISSTTFNEAVESYLAAGALSFVAANLDDSVRSCDSDGNLDAGEAGKLTITLRNTGWQSLTHTQVKVSASDPSVSFDGAGSASAGAIDPYSEASVSVGVSVQDGASARGTLHFSVTSSDSEALETSIDTSADALYNFDDVAATSATDDVESAHPVWQVDAAAQVWARQGDAGNHVWHGEDPGEATDQSLLSPPLVVSADDSFVLSFKHRYAFENDLLSATSTAPSAFDGGVIEISLDAGATWQDVSTYVDPGYTKTLYSVVNDPQADPAEGPDTNALAGRRAYGGQSRSYPAYQNVSLDLGRSLAGQTVQLRFRIGADANTGAPGWDIDDISFGSGISNLPFASIRDDAASCAAN